MRLDDAINTINGKYNFKILVFLVLSFPTYQNYGQLQAVLAAVIVPKYTCQTDYRSGNVSISPDQCTISVNGSLKQCSNWNFSLEPVGTTMISDYGLVCHRKYFGDLILLVWYSTSLIDLLFGWLSDRYGRKKVAIGFVALETISSLLLSFAPNVSWNIFLRILLGISASSVYITYVWLMESVDNGFRGFVGSFFWMYGCVAYMIFPLIIYATKNWRYTQLVSLIPSIFYIFLFFVPESPRWSFIMGRKIESIKTLKTIGRINKLTLNLDVTDLVNEEEKEERNFWVALYSTKFLMRLSLTALFQFSTYILYMAISVNVSILSSNVLLSMSLVGIMETPGLILSYFSLLYQNRKSSLIIFSLTGSVLIWISSFFSQSISWQAALRIVIGSVAKILIACVNQISMVYSAELFPTSHRSFGFSVTSLSSFLSFAGAIYVNKLSLVHFILPMTIYLILVWISCLLVFFFLPETKNLPFPETLHDQEMLRVGHEEEYVKYMENKNYESSLNVVLDVPMRNDEETTKLIG